MWGRGDGPIAEFTPSSQPSSVGTGGVVAEIDMGRVAPITRFVCLHTAGSASQFDVTFYDKDPNSGGDETDVIAEYNNVSVSDGVDDIGDFPYDNSRGNDTIYAEIVPDSGSDNDFFVATYADVPGGTA